MKRIVFLSCTSRKLSCPAPAIELYTSDFFVKARTYAQSLCPDMLFILSAKHGLLEPNDVIEPYDVTLNSIPINARRSWAKDVLEKLTIRTNLQEDSFTFLCGARYMEFLVPALGHVNIPMEGLPIGKKLSYLKKANSNA